MRVLVTGGTGFVGKNLVKHLLEQGYDVALFARRTSSLGGLPDSIDIRWGDVTEPGSFRDALDGVEAVFHLAALVKEWVPRPALFREVNVRALETLLRASIEIPLQRVVYTSSFIALGPSDEVGEADESIRHSPDHFHNLYERTKYEGSLLAEEYVRKGAPLVTVCPGVVYGPGEVTQGNIMVRFLVDLLRNRLPGLPGDGQQRWSFAFVNDVATGHRLAMEKGRVGERYILGGENASINDFFSIGVESAGVEKPLKHVPFWLLETVAAFEHLKAAITRRPPRLTLGAIQTYKHDWTYTSRKATAELGYSITPLREGLARTVKWLKEQKLI